MALTEDRIKAVCLRFLKSHYKFRPRTGPATAQFDMQGEGGIIADGHLQFLSESGIPFLATFEATSEYLFEEVKFKSEQRILFWDSMAAGFITAAMTYAYGLIWDVFTVRQVGWLLTLSILLAAGFIGFWLYRSLVRGRHRYRYIYAIEQFKRYHADAQWIAISDAIFPNSEDVYFDELRRQCVDNGIGLITVAPDESVHLLITPAREDVFDHRRKLLHFVHQEIRKGRTWGRRLSDKGRNFLDNLFGRAKNSSSLQRFRRSFYKQIMICFGAMGLISTIFFRQLQDRPIAYVDEKTYGAEVIKMVKEGEREPLVYEIDTPAVVKGNQKELPYFLPVEDSIVEIPTADQGMEYWTMKPEIPVGGEIDENAVKDRDTYICDRLYNFEGYLYLIRYRQFADFEQATQLVNTLANKGLVANILWQGCFKEGKTDYVLYFDLFYPDQEEAEKEMQKIKKTLLKKGFSETALRLVQIRK